MLLYSYSYTLIVQLRQRSRNSAARSHYFSCSHCIWTVILCPHPNPVPCRSDNGLHSVNRGITEWGKLFHKNESLKGYLEGLNEEGLVIISKFLHYSLFIIVFSASSLPKIVFYRVFLFGLLFTQIFLLTKCILLNHPKCLGIENNILGCKGMCGINLFCLDHQRMAVCHSYSYCYFCYRSVYQRRICNFTVAVQNHNKVITFTITFCNSEILIQNCLIYVLIYECGLQQGIIGLSVEMKMCG